MVMICCNQCFEHIAKKNPAAARVWLDMCKYYIKYRGTYQMNEEHISSTLSSTILLEELGYITTCDRSPAVMVRVNGYDVVDVPEKQVCLETFCLDREKHSDEWM